MAEIASTPKPPYYAVLFSSVRTEVDDGYGEMQARMAELGRTQPGFLGMESARDPKTRFGVTIVYWESLEAIEKWRRHAEHIAAKKKGRQSWYERYKLRIARVEFDREFA